MGNRTEPLKIVGHWTLRLIGPDGREKDVRQVKNLITNAGLEALKAHILDAAGDPFNYVAIGTGATAEAASDTALETEAARAAGNYTAGGTGVATIDATFGAGVGTGAIVECGLLNASASGDLFNRKTFAAINKGAGDTLKVSCVVTFAGA